MPWRTRSLPSHPHPGGGAGSGSGLCRRAPELLQLTPASRVCMRATWSSTLPSSQILLQPPSTERMLVSDWTPWYLCNWGVNDIQGTGPLHCAVPAGLTARRPSALQSHDCLPSRRQNSATVPIETRTANGLQKKNMCPPASRPKCALKIKHTERSAKHGSIVDAKLRV